MFSDESSVCVCVSLPLFDHLTSCFTLFLSLSWSVSLLVSIPFLNVMAVYFSVHINYLKLFCKIMGP